MKKAILLLFALLASATSWAFSSDGITYSITSSTEPYTVAVTLGSTKYSDTITIPSSVTRVY